jgi:hypothetical protein
MDIVETIEQDKVTIHLCTDADAQNPRTGFDNVGKLVILSRGAFLSADELMTVETTTITQTGRPWIRPFEKHIEVVSFSPCTGSNMAMYPTVQPRTMTSGTPAG